MATEILVTISIPGIVHGAKTLDKLASMWFERDTEMNKKDGDEVETWQSQASRASRAAMYLVNASIRVLRDFGAGSGSPH